MAELCQKLPVVFEIDTEKNRNAEHKLPVGYWIEDIVACILSELDYLFGMAVWAEPPTFAAKCQEIFIAAIGIRAPDPGKAFLQVSALRVVMYYIINNWTKEAIMFLLFHIIPSFTVHTFPKHLTLIQGSIKSVHPAPILTARVGGIASCSNVD